MARYNQTLENEYAYATECNLATLSGLLLKKSSPKSEIRRQTSICLSMLHVCARIQGEIEWSYGPQHNFSRVEDLLKTAKKDAVDSDFGNITVALTQWVEGHKG